jgi:hypothetical protein
MFIQMAKHPIHGRLHSLARRPMTIPVVLDPLPSRFAQLACQVTLIQGADRTKFSVFLQTRGRLPLNARFAMDVDHLDKDVLIVRVGVRRPFISLRGGDSYLADLIMKRYAACWALLGRFIDKLHKGSLKFFIHDAGCHGSSSLSSLVLLTGHSGLGSDNYNLVF